MMQKYLNGSAPQEDKMKSVSRRFHPSTVKSLIAKKKGAYSINQIDFFVGVDPSVLQLGDTVKITNVGTTADWSAYGGSATAVVGDEFELTSLTPRTDGGLVEDLNFQIDVVVIEGEMNNYVVYMVLWRFRYYSTGLTTGITWPSWWFPEFFLTRMNTPTITQLFVPSGSGLNLDDIHLSGPNIMGITDWFPTNNTYYGGDFPADSLPNYLFTSDLLQQLDISGVKSFFQLDSYEYEGKLSNYMRGQILYSYVGESSRSIRTRGMDLGYTNFSGDSPYQTSQATFYNYSDVQTGSSNASLIFIIIGLVVLVLVFAFFAFYPRGNRVSRFE